MNQKKEEDVLDLLRKWIDKNLPSGRVKAEIFVRNHKPYRFTLRTGDVEVGYEIGDKV